MRKPIGSTPHAFEPRTRSEVRRAGALPGPFDGDLRVGLGDGFTALAWDLTSLPDGFGWDVSSRRTVAITSPIPFAASTYAASWLDQRSGGTPSLGRSLNPAAGVCFHPHGFTTTATTRMSLRARRPIARLYSMFQQ